MEYKSGPACALEGLFEALPRFLSHRLVSGCSRERTHSFRQVNKQRGNRLRQQLVDVVTGEPVQAHNKARGYDVGENQFLLVRDDELEAAEQEGRSRPYSSVPGGASLAETSEFLCRSETFEVARKAKELGLTWQRGGHKRKPKPTWPFDRTPSQPGDCRRKLEGNSVHRAAGTIRDQERSRWQAVRGIARDHIDELLPKAIAPSAY
jgi:hypothetical protein